MKLIVIGASGFVGNHIFSLAKSKGYDVIGTRCSSNREDLIKFDLLSQRISDALPEGFAGKGEKVYAVICSAICKLNECYYNKDLSYALNVARTITLIDDFRKLGIKFAFISTEFVFDGLQGYYDETAPTSPVNEYGRQKVEVENYILKNLAQDLIFRLSKVVGDSPKDEHFFSDCYKKLKTDMPIYCIEGQMFSPTDVIDVAEGVLKAFELNLSGLYHLNNSEYFHRDELARQFLIAIGRKVEVAVKPLDEFGFPESRSMKTYMDGSKFVKATGIHFTPMKDVMKRFARRINRST